MDRPTKRRITTKAMEEASFGSPPPRSASKPLGRRLEAKTGVDQPRLQPSSVARG